MGRFPPPERPTHLRPATNVEKSLRRSVHSMSGRSRCATGPLPVLTVHALLPTRPRLASGPIGPRDDDQDVWRFVPLTGPDRSRRGLAPLVDPASVRRPWRIGGLTMSHFPLTRATLGVDGLVSSVSSCASRAREFEPGSRAPADSHADAPEQWTANHAAIAWRERTRDRAGLVSPSYGITPKS